MYGVYWTLAVSACLLVSTVASPDHSAALADSSTTHANLSAVPADPSVDPADSSTTHANLSVVPADPSVDPADSSATATGPDQAIADIARSMQYLLGAVIGHQQKTETFRKGIYARLENISSRQQGVRSQLEDLALDQQGMESQQADIASRQQGMVRQQEDIASRQQDMRSQREDIALRQQGMKRQLEHIVWRQQRVESHLKAIASRQQGVESQQKDIISRIERVETRQNYTIETLTSVAAETRILRTPRDCSDLPPGSPSGVYQVRLTSGVGPAIDAFCNQTIAEGGWTVFQRRADIQPRHNFYLTWEDYKFGFGNMDGGEFWWGLDKLTLMTSSWDRKFQLRIDLEDEDGNWGYVVYDNFRISSEEDGYKLDAGSFRGDVGDSLEYNVGHRFSTKDRDQDGLATHNCASIMEGAWWYRGCGYSSLNGRYEPGSDDGTAVLWGRWKDSSLKTVEMKLRPV